MNNRCALTFTLTVIAMMGGCAHNVIQSDHTEACEKTTTATDSPPCAHGIPVGFVYSLPKGQVLLAAFRKAITAADVAKAQADFASAKQAVAEATAKLEAAQKTQDKNKGPTESDSQKTEDQAAVDAAKATLTAAQASATSAQLKLTDAQSGAPKTAEDIKAANDAVTAEEQKVSDTQKALDKIPKSGHEGEIKTAQAALDAEKLALEGAKAHAADVLATKDGKFVETFTLTPQAIVPDGNQRFVANLDHLTSRDDTLKFSVVNGLLTTTSSQSTDQTASIISSLASAAIGIVTFVGAGIPVVPPQGRPIVKDKPESCEYVFTKAFDPTNSKEVEDINTALSAAQVQAHIVLRTGFPTPDPAAPSHHITSYLKKVKQINDDKMPIDGLVYRTPAGTQVEALPLLGSTTAAHCPLQTMPQGQSLQVFVPDTNAEFIVPAKAGALTASNFQFAFSSGMLTDYSVTRPSELAAGASIPVDIVNKIMTIPTSILKLRLDYSTAETNLATQKAALITAQSGETLALVNAKLALGTAETNLNTAELNDPTARYKALAALVQAKQALADAIAAAAQANAAATQPASK